MSITKKNLKKKRIWSSREESFLCELWATKIDMLRGARKNSHILEEMRVELEAMGGVVVTKEEVKTKMHNLTSRYSSHKKDSSRLDQKDKIGISGGSPSTWEMFNQVNAILGSFKVNNLMDVVEESISGDSFGYTGLEILIDDSQSSFFDDVVPSETSSSFEEMPSTSKSASTPSATPNNARSKKEELLKKILTKIEILEEKDEIDKSKEETWGKKLYELEVEKKNLLEKMVKDNEEVKF